MVLWFCKSYKAHLFISFRFYFYMQLYTYIGNQNSEFFYNVEFEESLKYNNDYLISNFKLFCPANEKETNNYFFKLSCICNFWL